MLKRFLLSILVILLSFSTVYAADKVCRCQPNQDCWPSEQKWRGLAKILSGNLVKPISHIKVCHDNPGSPDCLAALKNNTNPFLIQENPADSQSLGWFEAWESAVSPYAVEATSAEDVVAAVNFAQQHHLRLVVKGAGHDYLGRSNAPNSLLVWTHQMRGIKVHKGFRPAGCSKRVKRVPAVTVGAGTRWIEAYTEVTTKNNRYVQGGGCTSVGAAGGFTQGSGFGSYSKKFGTGAAGILQVEIVTADGKKRIANQCQNQDLFWAIRGGGGGTFGIVTKMTLRTHQLPKTFGVFHGTITAKSDQAYKRLINRFLHFYRKSLNNEHWGEQIAFHPQNKITFLLMYQGISEQHALKVWQPLKTWVKAHQNDYQLELNKFKIPPRKMWDYKFWNKHHPEFVSKDTSAGAPEGRYWWAPNAGEIWAYWTAYKSWWLPVKLFKMRNGKKLTRIIYDASRLTSLSLHINKGLAGASQKALKRTRRTALHRGAFDAAALVIIGDRKNYVITATAEKKAVEESIAKKEQAIQLFMQAAPNAGTYANETDYTLKDWQTHLWGRNYRRLYKIKQKYDPKGLFYCHHCVGSELWDSKGMCRR